MSWLAYSCRCDRYILRLTSIITYSGCHSSLWFVTGSFLHPNGLATSSCTYIAHPFFSKKSQWIKIFLFGLGAVWTVCLWWFLERSWSSLQNNLGMHVNKRRCRQGCQLPCLASILWKCYLFWYLTSLNCHAFLLNSSDWSCGTYFESGSLRSHDVFIPPQQRDSLQAAWLESVMCCFCLVFPPWGAGPGGFLFW